MEPMFIDSTGLIRGDPICMAEADAAVRRQKLYANGALAQSPSHAEAHAAVAAAEAERSTRAEAEGATETLRQEQERRARVFHNAVRAAVGRVQSQLERERDELQLFLDKLHGA
eukprot:1147121-Pelagomonas_calceolata.AAC.2